MEFEIACTCGQHMLVDGRFVGQEVACPGCQGLLRVPSSPPPGNPPPVVSPVTAASVGPAHSAPGGAPTQNVAPPPYAPVAGGAVQVGYGGVVGTRRTHGRATAALVCGILSIFACPIVLSIVSLVLASQAKRDIRERPDLYEGTGLATAGQACAIVGLVFNCIMGAVFFAVGMAEGM